MSLYQKKYRVESTRRPGWDYSRGGKYFVTICTKDRACSLGKIIGIETRFSEIGEIVAEEWQQTAVVRPTVLLDAWQIMPNHLHGILVLTHPPVPEETDHRAVSTNAPNSLGVIIGQFKAACTRRIRRAGFTEFDWQERFHDKIIRNEIQLVAIRQYIHDNPRKWSEDSDNSTNWQAVYRAEREARKKSEGAANPESQRRDGSVSRLNPDPPQEHLLSHETPHRGVSTPHDP